MGKRWFFIILSVLMLCVAAVSCRKISSNEEEPSSIPKNSLPDSETGNKVGELDISVNELSIYSLSINHSDIEALTALVSEEITPALIVEKVVESMEDASFQVKISSVETKDDIVIVDFRKDAPPVSGVTKETETAILDAIAQSLLDNLADYHKVIYRVEGGAYRSDNRSFAEDYVYIEK